MIEVENISVSLSSGRKILDEVSFNLELGKLTAIIGKNGAGKSSILKCICGDIAYEKGRVRFEGEEINEIDLKHLATKRAVVSQKSSLEFSFTAREVVNLGRSLSSSFITSAKDEAIILKCLEMVDGLSLIDQSYTTLSGGEKQRVHFARALAQIWDRIENDKPAYLILDEPLASLDVAHQHEMMHILQQLCKKNIAVMIVIHDLNLAAQYADYVHILKEGKTVIHGTPLEVFKEDIITHAFDYPVSVIPHPKIQCPLIISTSYMRA